MGWLTRRASWAGAYESSVPGFPRRHAHAPPCVWLMPASRCHSFTPSQPSGTEIQRRIVPSKESQIPVFAPTRTCTLSLSTRPAAAWTPCDTLTPRGSGVGRIVATMLEPRLVELAAIDPYAIVSVSTVMKAGSGRIFAPRDPVVVGPTFRRGKLRCTTSPGSARPFPLFGVPEAGASSTTMGRRRTSTPVTKKLAVTSPPASAMFRIATWLGTWRQEVVLLGHELPLNAVVPSGPGHGS